MDSNTFALILIVALIVCGTAVVIIFISQIFASSRARASAAREGAYRKLAEEAAEAQARNAEALEKASGELTAVRQQTTEMERLLKEVE